MDSCEPTREDNPKERRQSSRLRLKEDAALLEAHNVTQTPANTEHKALITPSSPIAEPKAATPNTWAIPRSVKKRLLEKVDSEEGRKGDKNDEDSQKLSEAAKESADEDTEWDICLRCQGLPKSHAKEVVLTVEERAACERALVRWNEMKTEIEVRIGMLEMCLAGGFGGEDVGEGGGAADPDA